MPYLADRVQETTSTSGTGAITLAGAVSGYRTFLSAFGSSPVRVAYLVVSGTSWEVGFGTFDGSATLTRDQVYSSSNSNAAITLSGTSNVFVTAPAELVDGANHGPIQAAINGMHLP